MSEITNESRALTRVLLVEDNMLDAHLVQSLLERLETGQCSVQIASTLRAAVQELQTSAFEMVILDLGLPDSSGLETLHRVRSYAVQAPIIVLTGTKDEAVGEAAIREGAQDYINKGELRPAMLVRSLRYARERHRASRDLQRSNELLSRTIASAMDAIITKTTDGMVTSWNPASERLFGYTAEEIIGKSIRMLIPPERLAEEEDLLARIRRGEQVEPFETVRRRKDGSLVHVSISLSPIRDAEGKVIGASKVARDITAQRRAEELLRISERRLRQFIAEAPVSVAMFDREMRYLAASRRWTVEYGHGKDDISGLRHYDLYPDIPERWKELHRRALAGEVLSEDQDLWRRADGSKQWLRWAMHPWHETSGEIGGLIISAEDVTERVRAEGRLRYQESLLRETGHLAKVGGWEVDLLSGESSWTEETAKIHEVDPEAPTSVSLGLGFYPAESRKILEEALRQATQDGIPYDLELEIITAKRNRRWVRTIAHPVMESGKVVKLRGSMQDITERRIFEETLRRQAFLFDQAYDAVMVWEVDGTITSWNKGAERAYGFSSAEAIGRSSHDLLATPKSQVEQFMQALNDGSAWEGELEHVRSDGKRIVVESRMVQVQQDGRRYVLETNRDVSEKRLLEEQLRQAQKMEAIGQLAGGVAHDFNNLLGVILGCSELASEYTDLEKVRKRLGEIRKAAERAASLTRQLLAFSRKQVLEPKVIDLSAKVSDATDMLTRLVGEDVEVHTSLAENVWSVRVDPSQFEQILLNLVVNAREAMPQGGQLTIETRNVELDQAYTRTHALAKPGRYVMISVSDSGTGMDAETQARIFEPFFTTKKTGSGLGLATVYGAVQQSGGNIWVYSEVGKGTTFKLYFPSVEGRGPEANSDNVAKCALGCETILLVEDSDSLRMVTREFLEVAGYRVEEARNGEQALQIARGRREPIDLLLTDVVMPGMSGPEVAKQVAQVHPEAKVLFMSGYTANAVVNHGALDDGMTLLSKPFSRASLTRKVRDILAGQPGTVPSSSGFD